MSTKNLAASDRALFSLVAEVAFVNPFSVSRQQLDQKMGGKPGAGLTEALGRVRSVLERLRRDDAADVRDYGDEDGRVLLMAVLYDAFHRWVGDFDQLIQRQVQDGDEPSPASFGREVMDYLMRHGIRSAEAQRYVGMFYQLRRAFYFTHRELIGSSPCMRALRIHCWNNIFTCDLNLYLESMVSRMEDFSTLLLGETGSGKGAVAGAIGRSGFISYDVSRERFSESFTRTFISLNLAQFPETLIESELFGHRKGAFTGAISDRDGVFARCRPHGAIFLDEIGDVPRPIQLKLLQVLQDRQFTPVGSYEKKRFAGRVIAATNQPLDALRRSGDFRDDFYYRLCSDVIYVPPLRERIAEDADELARLVGVILARQVGQTDSAALIDRVMTALHKEPGRAYSWPGNVRELEQAVRRILVAGVYNPDRKNETAPESERWLSDAAAGSLTAEALMTGYCRMMWKKHGTYEEVSRRTGLDRRTVKKHVTK